MKKIKFVLLGLFFFILQLSIVNAQCGVEAGQNQTIVCGDAVQLNAKPKWVTLNSGITNYLSSVYFTNTDTGYAAGDLGTILKTTNGGATWTTQTSGTTKFLLSGYFVDAKIGYVVGNYDNGCDCGTILKTTNGGTNWTQQVSGTLYNLNSVYFTSADTGYVVAIWGGIFKTTNGGVNWTAQTSGTTKWLNSVYFTDANTGYAVGYNGTILKTSNSGTNWTVQTSGITDSLTSVYFTDANTGYIVGSNGRILKFSEPVSYSWVPANGLNATNISNPIANLITTTTYIVTATTANDCTAIDSVTVYVNPFTTEAGTDKTIICGGTTQLDNVTTNYTGSGTLEYHWSPSTGLNNDTILNPTASATSDTKYFVTVTTPNGCMAIDSVIVQVDLLTANAGTDKTIICGGTTQLDNVTTNYTGTDTLTYAWAPATGLNNDTILNPTTTATGITYTVSVTTPNGCIATDNVSVNLTPMTNPDVCIVGIDSTNKNMVVWNKPFSLAIDSFHIYRETDITDIYEKIGAVPYDSMSVFIDTSSHPDVQSNKYKISIKDSCGLESIQSDYHKTMHLAINQGMGNVWNLIWDPYEGFTVSTYKIYRGTAPDSLLLIGTTSGGNTQYSDLLAPSGYIYYQVEVISPNSCNPSKSYNSSRSNIATNNGSGINENINASDLFSIYPNPASKVITLNINNANNKALTLNIYNAIGSLVKTETLKQNQQQINVGDLDNGIYIVEIKFEGLIRNQKLIIQR